MVYSDGRIPVMPDDDVNNISPGYFNRCTPQRTQSNPCAQLNRSGSVPLHRIRHRYSLARAQRSAPATYNILARMLVGRGHIDQCDTDLVSGASLLPFFYTTLLMRPS